MKINELCLQKLCGQFPLVFQCEDQMHFHIGLMIQICIHRCQVLSSPFRYENQAMIAPLMMNFSLAPLLSSPVSQESSKLEWLTTSFG